MIWTYFSFLLLEGELILDEMSGTACPISTVTGTIREWDSLSSIVQNGVKMKHSVLNEFYKQRLVNWDVLAASINLFELTLSRGSLKIPNHTTFRASEHSHRSAMTFLT